MESYTGFEQGPIRPPSEANSLLLRVTRNCPWNRCTFCSVYKRDKFSLRKVEDVIRDIDAVHHFATEFQGRDDTSAPEEDRLSGNLTPADRQALYAAQTWLAEGMKSVFLQDADSLVIKPEKLVKILKHIKMRFPTVERITSYARSDTIARISDENLKEMAAAGLNRIHIGLETASDKILKMINKGVSKDIHINAGIKTRNAGIELSEYVLTGIGGREFSREHAIETADALNQINPDFIRFRTLRIPDTLNLFENSQDCHWQRPPDLVLANEILLLIENLENITGCIKSDHMFNLFQEIDGRLPQDKERLMDVLRTFIAMEPEERALFQAGKRFGQFLRLRDMLLPGRRARVEELCRQLDIIPGNVDDKLHEMIQKRMIIG